MIKKTIRKNRYGNVDIRRRVPKTLTHFGRERAYPYKIRTVCRAVYVPYADALVGFKKFRGNSYPRFDGVVVPKYFGYLVEEELQKREMKREKRMAASLRRLN